MSEADILELTYEDKVTVYRAQRIKLPSGETVYKKDLEGLLIYTDVKCALSRQTGGKLEQSPSVAKAPTEYSLFVRPEIDIQANDYLVITQLGKTVIATAGRAARLSSHNNVPLKLKEESV